MTDLDTEIIALVPLFWQFSEEKQMTYILEITKNNFGWNFVTHQNKGQYEKVSCTFSSFEAAIEAGSKRLLELLPKTFDFGQGPVPAHKHKNGGGWVADTAQVTDSVYVGPNTYVYENAKVCGGARICENARVYGHAEVYGFAYIFENAHVHCTAKIFEYAKICGNANIDSGIICGYKYINASNEKYVLVDTKTLECFGPFNSPGEASKAMLPGISYKIRKLEK